MFNTNETLRVINLNMLFEMLFFQKFLSNVYSFALLTYQFYFFMGSFDMLW